jgi:hypothetical protein
LSENHRHNHNDNSSSSSSSFFFSYTISFWISNNLSQIRLINRSVLGPHCKSLFSQCVETIEAFLSEQKGIKCARFAIPPDLGIDSCDDDDDDCLSDGVIIIIIIMMMIMAMVVM